MVEILRSKDQTGPLWWRFSSAIVALYSLLLLSITMTLLLENPVQFKLYFFGFVRGGNPSTSFFNNSRRRISIKCVTNSQIREDHAEIVCLVTALPLPGTSEIIINEKDNYRPQTKLWKGNVFTSVCLPVILSTEAGSR